MGSVPFEVLADVRREMHWAAQAIDTVGRTLAEPEPNFEHVALRWREDLGALSTAPVQGRSAALVLATAEVAILASGDRGEGGGIEDRMPLSGRTLLEVVSWVRSHFEAAGETKPEWKPLRDDLAASPVAEGAPFQAAGQAHRDLAGWVRNAAELFERLAAEETGAARVLCWPHHFDLATFVNLDPEKAQYEGRSINIGLSLGDEIYPQPYYYLVPYPTPVAEGLPPLPEPGGWRTDGWVGAVLTGEHVTAVAAERQGDLLERFVRSALGESKRLLGAG